MKHAGSDVVALKAGLATAAGLTVGENRGASRFVAYRQMPARLDAVTPPMRQDDQPAQQACRRLQRAQRAARGQGGAMTTAAPSARSLAFSLLPVTAPALGRACGTMIGPGRVTGSPACAQ